MRICLRCHRIGLGVDKCPRKDESPLACLIADKGTEIVPAGDHISTVTTGQEIIEVVPSNPSAPTPGDALMGVGTDLHIPTVSRFNSGTVEDPLARVMAQMDEAKKRALAEVTSEPVLPMRGPRAPVTSPDGNPKTAIGMTKPSLHSIPPVALVHLGLAMTDGNRKYGLVNWRHDPITMSVYVDAIWRHFLALWDGQDVDPKTGIKHLAYIMANCAILLDAEAQGTLTDDRSPIRGKVAELIEQLTNMMKET